MNAKEISLEEVKVKPVVDHLNDLLANYHIHYQKLRGCHWNVKGTSFFTLHLKFEEMYTAALVTIDELAERILSLGKPPISTFKDYIETSSIKETQTIGLKDTLMVKAIIDDLAALIKMEREILTITADAGDDGTNDMINRFMQFNEKNTWMLRSFVNED
ncbi:DNA starvation/stationary phase protection protein [Mucilaginibacter gossypii]|uniref:Dps family protein n=1 Tax=Mucilaginibacter gossypii TaxID=551996 RepID=UPI000DCEC46D|nr:MULTISPECIES: DNA starvation/stationary phase protection protein [Mucilaginibacter]QTE37618.1 DNA starvation/stationary phase protection protein [Mucilaginibacter gossypii]RAV58461.1 DNA starvation/stationary phase protection protein [Mucilaginibacter rubeus]